MPVDIASVLSAAKRIHFIGVGGSGMFPIVQIMLAKGYEISGSDVLEGDILDYERKLGVRVIIGQTAENVHGAGLVVYSAAIPATNPERQEAARLNIPCVERSEMLGYVASLYAKPLCIAGTHGKTTATGMATQILEMAGFDPAAVIGGKLPLIGGYGKAGSGSAIVVEACEYHNTFLQLCPDAAVLLNVDADHLEFFGNMENLKAAFRKFCAQATGAVIYNGDDESSLEVVSGLPAGSPGQRISFGFGPDCTLQADKSYEHKPGFWAFTATWQGEELGQVMLGAPGRHNIYNALAAICGCMRLGASFSACAAGLAAFAGTGRRFEVMGEINGITVVDDYAHHPAELEAVLTTAKNMGYDEVWALFQPYTYSRTEMLLDDFAKALSIADKIILTDIMGGRECAEDYTITTGALAEKIPGSLWLHTQPEVARHVLENAAPGTLALTLGCGDMYKCAHMILGDRA